MVGIVAPKMCAGEKHEINTRLGYAMLRCHLLFLQCQLQSLRIQSLLQRLFVYFHCVFWLAALALPMNFLMPNWCKVPTPCQVKPWNCS